MRSIREQVHRIGIENIRSRPLFVRTMSQIVDQHIAGIDRVNDVLLGGAANRVDKTPVAWIVAGSFACTVWLSCVKLSVSSLSATMSALDVQAPLVDLPS